MEFIKSLLENLISWFKELTKQQQRLTVGIVIIIAIFSGRGLLKNDLDGTIDDALREIDDINSARRHIENSGKAILIYRGGDNAQNPDTWTQNYLNALEQTNGKLIVDTAHGAEMAFHPDGLFKKSVAGQQASLSRVLELAEKGAIPLGIMMEASDTIETSDNRRVDPNMPFNIAIEGLRRLSAIANPISID